MEENKEQKQELINPVAEEVGERWDYSTYLIGSMEKPAEKDDGSSMREDVEKELILRDVYPINPVKLETSKTGMSVEEAKEKMTGWISSGNWEKFAEVSKKIWMGEDVVLEGGALAHLMGDMDYVIASNWITMSYRKGDQPCGTFAEVGVAVYKGIPVYLITNFIKRDLPKSLLQLILCTEGEVFENLHQYLEFIDKKYKLRRKEEKK